MLYLVDPFNDKKLLNNKLFESPFRFFYERFNEKGVELKTYDLDKLTNADKVIFFNHNKNLLRSCKNNGIEKDKRVLVLWEPETVYPLQYRKGIWENYSTIITIRKDLSKKYCFPHIFWPQGQTIRDKTPGFKNRKFITLINANKYSYVNGELYSLRREAIRFFEKYSKNSFDLFGRGWSENPFFKSPGMFLMYVRSSFKNGKFSKFISDVFNSFFIEWPSFKGEIDDKYEYLAQYKFAISFENEDSIVTEKLFDALSCGTIPIYKGPDEINEIVPSNCYINFDDFSSFEDLNNFLQNLSEEDFDKYQENINEYLKSDIFKSLRPEVTLKKLADLVG